MSVKQYILETLKDHKMHMTLIDPDKQLPEASARIAKRAVAFKTDAIMVGGSTGITQEKLDKTIECIKGVTDLPVIYFPSGANAIAQRCDAIYFMSMLNSLNVKNVTGEQSKGALTIRKLGLETISMGYVIVEPGMKVGEVGEAEVVPRDNIPMAVGYALTAEMFGMDLLYLESGSGAPEPVPSDMIRAVRESVRIPLIIGGGITSSEHAATVLRAGGDIVVTGTLVENGGLESQLEHVVDTVHSI
ncbi:MAG: geranylgeranylglyceryl/heptaprenylglyceryl phosphate synthase [Candidatus Thermoplasmatota archaeon]|nr:geranylgeranylglyceryl/heptaprenylglyceryl phosphate synthase [Candidatus Thermoplasmatota archaeon]